MASPSISTAPRSRAIHVFDGFPKNEHRVYIPDTDLEAIGATLWDALFNLMPLLPDTEAEDLQAYLNQGRSWPLAAMGFDFVGGRWEICTHGSPHIYVDALPSGVRVRIFDNIDADALRYAKSRYPNGPAPLAVEVVSVDGPTAAIAIDQAINTYCALPTPAGYPLPSRADRGAALQTQILEYVDLYPIHPVPDLWRYTDEEAGELLVASGFEAVPWIHGFMENGKEKTESRTKYVRKPWTIMKAGNPPHAYWALFHEGEGEDGSLLPSAGTLQALLRSPIHCNVPLETAAALKLQERE